MSSPPLVLRALLREALGWLRLGTLKGSRLVTGRPAYEFVLSWSEAKAPFEPVTCCLTFPHYPLSPLRVRGCDPTVRPVADAAR